MMKGITAAAVILSFFSWIGTAGPKRPSLSGAACTLTVEAGRDTVLCAAGQRINLNARASQGNLLAVRWSPGNLVADSTQLATTAVINQTTTFQVSVFQVQAENLIINGDFSLGDFGFRSDYNYGNSTGNLGILTQENQYAIDNNPADAHRRFARCGDHTTGSGNMMIVNASGQSNNVWCQTVQVQPNTTYVFSAWIASAVSENPARLAFNINGANLGTPLVAPSATCQWRQFYALWNSGSNTQANICLMNINLSAAGNDFLLDDLSLSPVCVATDTLTARIANPRAEWSSPAAVCQNGPAFALETLLAPGASTGGRWTLDGQAAVAVNPARLSAGIHTLSYAVEDGPCLAERTENFTVIGVPSAGQALPELRFCSGTDSVISLPSRLVGASAGGRWTDISPRPAPPGAFDAAAAGFRTVGVPAGEYLFRYQVDAQAPCQGDQEEVRVVLFPQPVADAGDPQILDCVVKAVQLGGERISQGPDFSIQWTDSDGFPLPTAGDPFPEVDQPGVYTLTVIESVNGCSAVDSVEVISQITQPQAQLTVKKPSCFGDQDGAIYIDEVLNAQGPFVFSLNGGGMTPKNQFEQLAPGIYELAVEDANGCADTVSVTVEQANELAVALDVNLPGDPPVLSLGDSVLLRAQVNVPVDQIREVRWEPAADSCRNCLSMRISPLAPTLYKVRVTDLNGCRAEARMQLAIERRKNVFIPNAFSPNNDGVNDVLMIHAGPEVEQVSYFRIKNRWGSEVYNDQLFAPNDPGHAWNGYFRGRRMRAGVYVYVAELVLVDGRKLIVSGDVTLVD